MKKKVYIIEFEEGKSLISSQVSDFIKKIRDNEYDPDKNYVMTIPKCIHKVHEIEI